MLNTVAALIVAAVFLLSGVAKTRNISALRDSADALVGRRLPHSVAPLLVSAELLTAVLSIAPQARVYGALAALTLLAVFTFFVVRSLLQGRKPTCFCFGALDVTPISWLSVVRNCAIATIAGIVLLT
jgi:Methylamine utilisation protein MauE